VRLSVAGSSGLSWPELREAASLSEQLGFDAFYTADHLMAVAGFSEEQGMLDGVSVLLALAPLTRTIRLGALVSPVTVRHPVVLTRAVQTLDIISGGRAELGLGAGWSASEHAAFGLPFPPASRRLELLEDACRTITALWSGQEPAAVEGAYPVRRARLRPPPVQPAVPLLVGGASDRAVAIAARWAVRWNATGSPGFLAERVQRLRQEERLADDVGSAASRGGVEVTATVRLFVSDDAGERDRLERAVRKTLASRRAQASRTIPGEDAMRAVYLGPPAGLPEYMASLGQAGVERVVLPLPRPWSAKALEDLARHVR
jgi:alkanesulfonate monooxygenase SsuD/methylene tetrahydromethanopterin reductase-like flavin-dependent oxidoreductase (luciferase family)